MSDIERRLEDLFTGDSRSRRVVAVDLPERRSGPPRGLTLVGASALAVLALIVALNAAGLRDSAPLASPGASASPAATFGGEVVVRCGQTTQFIPPTADRAGSFVLASAGRVELVIVPAGGGLAAAGGYNCARIKPGTPSGELIEMIPMNSPDYVPPPSASAPPRTNAP